MWHRVLLRPFYIMYNHTFSLLTHYHIRHQAIYEVGCQPDDCRWTLQSLSGVLVGMHGLTYSLCHPWGWTKDKIRQGFVSELALTIDKQNFLWTHSDDQHEEITRSQSYSYDLPCWLNMVWMILPPVRPDDNPPQPTPQTRPGCTRGPSVTCLCLCQRNVTLAISGWGLGKLWNKACKMRKLFSRVMLNLIWLSCFMTPGFSMGIRYHETHRTVLTTCRSIQGSRELELNVLIAGGHLSSLCVGRHI